MTHSSKMTVFSIKIFLFAPIEKFTPCISSMLLNIDQTTPNECKKSVRKNVPIHTYLYSFFLICLNQNFNIAGLSYCLVPYVIV